MLLTKTGMSGPGADPLFAPPGRDGCLTETDPRGIEPLEPLDALLTRDFERVAVG